MSEEAQFPPETYTHSLKISDTAKGLRFDVHVWASDRETALEEAFLLYEDALTYAAAHGMPLPPIEVKGK